MEKGTDPFKKGCYLLPGLSLQLLPQLMADREKSPSKEGYPRQDQSSRRESIEGGSPEAQKVKQDSWGTSHYLDESFFLI